MQNTSYSLTTMTQSILETRYLSETTIFFVVEGKLSIDLNNKMYLLSKGNFLVGNINDRLKIEAESLAESSGFILTIDNAFFTSIYPKILSTRFICYSEGVEIGKQETYLEIRRHLCELILTHYSSKPIKDLIISMSLNQIILWLVQYFKQEHRGDQQIQHRLILDVLNYLDEHYFHPITLEDVSKEFFMTPSALSKLFKDVTGTYFSTYLNELRISRSMNDLLFTGLSMDEIAHKSGFGSSKTYRDHFKKIYDESPGTYRKNKKVNHSVEKKEEVKSEGKKEVDILNALYAYSYLTNENTSKITNVLQHKKLNMVRQSSDTIQQTKVIIQVGSLNELLDYGTFKELERIQKEIGIAYIGVQSLYNDLSSSYRIDNGQHLPIFSIFGKFDGLLNYLEKEGIGILLQVSLKAYKAMSSNEKQKNITFVKHLVNKKKTSYKSKWRVNYSFDSRVTDEDVANFKTIQQELKQILSFIQIGVTLPIDYPDYTFLTPVLKQTFLEEVLPNCCFVSVLSEPNKIYEAFSKEIAEVERFQEYTCRKVNKVNELLTEWQIDLPIVILEWNTLTGSNQFIGGNFFRGAIIFQELLKINQQVESCGFWINAGLFEKYLNEKPMKYDGLELFHNYSGCRPVYFILHFLKRLQGKIISSGSNYALIEEGEHYQLLLWNTNYFSPNLSVEATFLESLSIVYHVDTELIKPNYYQIKQFELNRESGALFFSYADFDSRVPLDFEAHQYLSESTKPKLKVFDMEIINQFEIDATVSSNGLILYEFLPIYK